MLAKSFADEVVERSAKLKGYARKLTGNRSAADDLIQETILRALVHSDQFKAGTNLSAWLSTILRNCYFNELRRSRQFSALNEAICPQQPPIDTDQMWAVQAKETAQHVAALPRVQREALSLVAVEGNSYEIAARKAGCASGTMKSRVSRARAALLRAAEAPARPAERCRDLFRNDLDHLDKVA